jgi:hypothetical protein
MRVTRIFTGRDQRSYFDDVDVPLTTRSAIGDVSEYLPLDRMRFRRRGPGIPIGRLNAPERQFAVVLAGAVEVEVADGVRRRLEPGSISFVEDTTGEGHIARVDGFVEQVYVVVADDFDFLRWARGLADGFSETAEPEDSQ